MGSKNKTIVLHAFGTLFNRRDYAAAEQFWAPDCIRHSAFIGMVKEETHERDIERALSITQDAICPASAVQAPAPTNEAP